jgi:hypothetical protein
MTRQRECGNDTRGHMLLDIGQFAWTRDMIPKTIEESTEYVNCSNHHVPVLTL